MSTTLGPTTAARAQGVRLRAWLRTRAIAVPTAAGLFAVLVTAIGSWIPSLWGDEAASALSAQRSLPSFLHEVAHVDAVHAVYYAGLHVWVALFGASPFSLRFPSAIATGVMVAGVVVLVRLVTARPVHRASWRLPLIAGAIAMMLPRLDYAGVEARGYSWTAAFAVWIVIIGVATLTGRLGAGLGWSWFAVVLGVGTALNLYLGSLIVVIGCLVVLWHPRGERRVQLLRWGWSSLVAVALASPIIVLGALEHGQVAFLAHRPMPPSSWLVNQWFFTNPYAALGWLLLIAAVIVVMLRRTPRPQRRLGLAAVLWAGIPSAFLIGTISTLHNYSPRYLTFTAPAVAILMALAVEVVFRSWRPAGAALLVVVLGAAVPSYAMQRTPNAENNSDWAQVGAVIAANAQPGDQVAFDQVVRPSRRPENAYRVYPTDFRNVTAPQIEVPYTAEPTWHDKVMKISTAASRDLFTAGTVFAVEANYPGEGVLDVSGVPSLEESGYHVVRHWQLHSDLVFELDRDGVEQP
ncbi:hypothetical protein [Gryllotalpicola koreensis]|uniref:Glycosyltransferase RgtA/B/C/D-like domain-containing protein n=1 Tax=Gryllotalpicola koreensis TaxID=993086 RepID=A0ABP7ZS28_9MICO